MLLQRLAQIVRALAQLVDQPRILDRDDRLRGKCLEQRKLLVRQRSDGPAHDAERADRGIAAHHRHDGDRAVAARKEILRAGRDIGRRVRHIGNVEGLRVENRNAVHVVAMSGNGKRLRQASARAESCSATAAALILSPSGSATLMAASAKSLSPLRTMASNTGCVSVGELAMISRISAVAASRSIASFSARAARIRIGRRVHQNAQRPTAKNAAASTR